MVWYTKATKVEDGRRTKRFTGDTYANFIRKATYELNSYEKGCLLRLETPLVYHAAEPLVVSILVFKDASKL